MEIHFKADAVNSTNTNVDQATSGTYQQNTYRITDFAIGSSAPAVTGGSAADPIEFLTGVDFHIGDQSDWKVQLCKDFHVVTEELLEQHGSDDENVVGVCERCGVRVFIPRVPGAFSFEKAGVMMGRAMSLHDDDGEEAIGELVLEIDALLEAIDKDIRRHKRAMEALQIARTMARKQLVKVAGPIE